MIWLIYIINIFLWGIAAIVLAIGLDFFLFGLLYFVVGYPLSIYLLRYSDNYAVSFLDKLKYPPFTIWFRRLIWSNGIAMSIIWGLIFFIAIIVKVIT